MAASCWPGLPQHLLRLFIAHLPFPADHARFRAVCRSWRAAVHEHVSSRQLPWVVLPDGCFLTPSDIDLHRLPSFPENASCIGSTDDWIVLRHDDTHSFILHNPFSDATVPLPELDTVIGNNSEVRKVLMRYTADDLIVAITDNGKYPVIITRPGKDSWLPGTWEFPYIYIIDVAFLGDKLYAITKAEDLLAIDIGSDDDNKPTVVRGTRVIRHPPAYNDYDAWCEEEEAAGGDADQEEEEGVAMNDDDDGRAVNEQETMNRKEDNSIVDGVDYAYDELGDRIIIIRYLAESRGKLFMVRRRLQTRRQQCCSDFTLGVDILEADESVGVWVPVVDGLGGGQALFISRRFSRFVPTPSGDVHEYTVYFADTDFLQKQGIDFDEVFASVARLESACLLLALAAHEGWPIHHMDVKSAFLNNDMKEEVDVKQPPGFVVVDREHKVLKLRKALYGLQQAPRAWNAKLDATLVDTGFRRCNSEHAIYPHGSGRELLLLGVYVDDLVIT
ncbi:hypothetical protein VPH35_034653 [Triticum aestivum]